MQREVSLHLPALRIISLVPSQTELLFAIGAGESVVGITKFCTEPPEEVPHIAKVGGTKKFDFEAIAALKPDLIICNKEENYAEGVEQLAQDYPVWVSDIVTLEDSLEMIRQVGVLAGKASEADAMACEIADSFTGLTYEEDVSLSGLTDTSHIDGGDLQSTGTYPESINEIGINKPVKIAYFIWQKPYMVAGGGTFIDEMLKLGGMTNVFASLERYPEVGMDTLKASDAEVILLSSEPYPFREKHLAAFREDLPDKKIILVDAMPFSWYGSQLLRTAAYLRELRMKF